MTRLIAHICAAAILMLPQVLHAQNPIDWDAVKALIAEHSENHQAALFCYERDSADYQQTLEEWDLTLLYTLDVMVEYGFPADATYDVRADYGISAIFPSLLYTAEETGQSCEQNQAAFARFQSPDTTPLVSAVWQMIRASQ